MAMDVLHFLRSDHEAIKLAFDCVDRAPQVSELTSALKDATSAVGLHLDLEREFLYPEIAGAFNGVDALVSAGLANAAVIEKKVKEVHHLLSDADSAKDDLLAVMADLKRQTLAHFEQEERLLLPKLREFVRTEIREDLGEVLLDVQEERNSKHASRAKTLGRSNLLRA